MDREEMPFDPKTIDEQIDERCADASPMASSADHQMLHALKELSLNDERRVDQIWARLQEHAQFPDRSERVPIDIRLYQRRTAESSGSSGLSGQFSLPQTPKKTHRQRFRPIVAGLVALSLIASLLIVPALLERTLMQAHSSVQSRTTTISNSLIQHDIYMSDSQGVIDIDATTGQQHWRYFIPDYALSDPQNPVVGNGLVYAESQDSIYAINEKTGVLNWSRTFQSQFSPYPSTKARFILNGNDLYVSVVFMQVIKMDALTGQVLATYKPVLNTNIVSIAIAHNVLYAFGLFDMCAIRLSDGKQLWYRQLNQPQALGIPHVVNGVIYTVTSNVGWPYVDPASISQIRAFDISTGADIWQSRNIDGSVTDITLDHGIIYDGATDGSITAYDMHNGSVIWSRTIAGVSFSGSTAPQIDDSKLYLDAEDPTMAYVATGIVAVDERTGHIVWQYPGSLVEMKHAGHMFMPLTVQHGVIFVNDAQGGQSASTFDAFANDKQLWSNTFKTSSTANGQ